LYTVKKTRTSLGYISETVKDSKFLKTDIDSACPQLLPAKNVEQNIFFFIALLEKLARNSKPNIFKTRTVKKKKKSGIPF
jgi:hypothetical protein